jgi:hypothetical protein
MTVSGPDSDSDSVRSLDIVVSVSLNEKHS